MTTRDVSGTNEMIQLRQNDWTLQEIADKFGISRERVRQRIGNTGFQATQSRVKKNRSMYEQFKHLSNSALQKVLGIKTINNYRDDTRHAIDGGSLQVGTESEVTVSKKLHDLGFKNELMPHFHPFDILLDNGITVDVKSSDPMTSSKTISPCYTFNTKKAVKGNYCDFLILYLRDAKECFVVPMKEAGNIIRFCFPEGSLRTNNKVSKWLKYHNRFDLLKEATAAR